MKKLFAFLLAVIMTLSISACGAGEKSQEKARQKLDNTSISKIKENADECLGFAVCVYAQSMFGGTYNQYKIASQKKTDDYTYTFYGKVSGKDKYGNGSTKNFETKYYYELKDDGSGGYALKWDIIFPNT